MSIISDISSRNSPDLLSDCSPLSMACIKALTDRMDDKRKFAANEIEKMTVEFSMSNNLTMINRLILVLGQKFCLSNNQNTRKGGLLGLAAVIVGFKNGSINEPATEMVEEVVRPILTCMMDSDPRVRYYACESLYNVTKVAKSNILPLFESIFDTLTRLVADPDVSVRSGSETLDRLLKDIVVESTNDDLDVEKFVTKLEEYIYTQNPFTRMFIISWIRLLDSKVDLVTHLPQLLDGILNCLYDSTEEICASTLVLLSEFLNKIVLRPTDQLNMVSFINTLLKHARNDREDPVQYTAIAWLRQLIRLMNGPELIQFAPSILLAILPCLAYQSADDSLTPAVGEHNHSFPQQNRQNPHHSQRTNLQTAASFTAASQTFHTQTRSTYNIAPFSAANQGNICEISTLVNSSLQELVIQILNDKRRSSSQPATNLTGTKASITDVSSGHPGDQTAEQRLKQHQRPETNELEAITEVLAKELQLRDHPVIKLAILDWFKALKRAEPHLMFSNSTQQKLFQNLLETLSARSDAVVKNALRVITEVFCDDTSEDIQQQQQQQATLTTEQTATSDHLAVSQLNKEDTSTTGGELTAASPDTGTHERKRSPAPRGSNLSSTSRSPLSKGSPKRVAITTSEPSTVSQSQQPQPPQQTRIETNFFKFVQALYKTFQENELMFEDRCKFIIVNLCSMTKPETVYGSLAEIIKEEKYDQKFAYNFVQKLNQILLTAPALFGLRSRLSNSCLDGGVGQDLEMSNLFNSLLAAWSQSPVPSITLCLLTGNYQKSKDLVMSLARVEITMDILMQVDWVVQLIESPIFTSLRLRLLEPGSSKHQYLVQTLYGLLMVLPQSDAYRKLSHRLDQVHKFTNIR